MKVWLVEENNGALSPRSFVKVWVVEDDNDGVLAICATKERAEQAAQEAAEAQAARVPGLIAMYGHDEVVRRAHCGLFLTEIEVLT